METEDTLSSCSDLDEQEIQQLQKHAKVLKENSLNKLNALQTTIQHLSSSNYSRYNEFRDAFHRLFKANERTFKDVLSQNMQNLERQLNKETLHEKDSNSSLNFKAYTNMEAQTFKETIIQNMNSIEKCIVERASHEQKLQNGQKRLDDKKLQIQECTVQEVKALDAILEDKAQEHCMISFRQLHSHLKLLSNNDLNGTRTKSGFKRAFATLFGQDVETFIGTMFLNVDQLEKQLDKEEFQEIGSMASFKVLETQFQMFIMWKTRRGVE
ncbi:hypothetical protein Tco_0939447 [Tanacetum coccineum]|uniref:Uncharacterized protein n=1 Tax=Tanacetum coccineum TaxID=301880 RepID=A0ABQ5DKM7_9ASTR